MCFDLLNGVYIINTSTNVPERNKIYNSLQVAELYLLYQKAARLQSYLDDINELLTNTENLRAGADSLNDQFSKAKTAVKSSLSIDLKHES